MALECQFCENLPIKPIKTKKKKTTNFFEQQCSKIPQDGGVIP